MIFGLFAALVGGSTTPEAPAYTTIATRSFWSRWSTMSFSERLSNGSLLGAPIDPDTSSKNTRLDAGLWFKAISRPLSPIRTSRCWGVQGASLTSTCTAKGLASFGGA